LESKATIHDVKVLYTTDSDLAANEKLSQGWLLVNTYITDIRINRDMKNERCNFVLGKP